MEGREGSEGVGRRGERGSEDDSRCAKAWHHLGLDPLAPVGAGAGVGFRWFMRGVGRWRWDDGGWVGGNRCAATQMWKQPLQDQRTNNKLGRSAEFSIYGLQELDLGSAVKRMKRVCH